MQRPIMLVAAGLALSLTACEFETVEQESSLQEERQWVSLGVWAMDTLGLGSQFYFAHPADEPLAEQRILTGLASSLSQVTGSPIRLNHYPTAQGQATSCEQGSFEISGQQQPNNYVWSSNGSLNANLQAQFREIRFDNCVQGDWRINGDFKVTNGWFFNYHQSPAYSHNTNQLSADLQLTQLSSQESLGLQIHQASSKASSNQQAELQALSGAQVRILRPNQSNRQMQIHYQPTWNFPHLGYQLGNTLPHKGKLELRDNSNILYLRVEDYQLEYRLNQQASNRLNWSEANWVAAQR